MFWKKNKTFPQVAKKLTMIRWVKTARQILEKLISSTKTHTSFQAVELKNMVS